MSNRRSFIKNTILTAAAAGLTGKYAIASADPKTTVSSTFRYRTLGKTGIQLPIVSLGTGNTSNPALVRAALDKGLQLLATSETYQNGNNERVVATAVRELPRDSYIIMTSSGELSWIDKQTGVINDTYSVDKHIASVRGSLSRLGVDYVDVLIQPFAGKRESVLNDRVLKAMEIIKKDGLARFTGIGTHGNEPEAVRAASDSGIHDVVMTSYNFLKRNRDELGEAINYAAAAGLGVVAMKTMAGAYWDRERTRPINTRAALKWVLKNENITTAVPDCSSFEQLEQNIDVMSDPELTENEIQDLFPSPDKITSSLFCQQCGRCLEQCPRGLNIPMLMRSYMYAYGHHNLPHARYIFLAAGPAMNPCGDCTSCNITCTMGFNIRQKISDISKIIDIPPDFLNGSLQA